MKKSILGIVVIIVVISSLFWKSKNSYSTALVKRGNVIDAIYGLGKVKSRKTFEVKIGIMTNVKKLYVQEGQKVNKGDKLISFEGAGIFYAPFSGTITSVLLKEFEIALPNTSILKLVDLGHKYIEVSLEQTSALKVKNGQEVLVIFDEFGKKEKGIVQSIYPKKNEFIAHIEVNRIEDNVLPGMTADTVITIGKKDNVLLIPVSSYHHGFVTRVREGKKTKLSVELGHADGQFVEVVKGDLKTTDSVVIPKG